MPNVFSRNERFYVQKETTYGVVPHTAGVATVGNADAARHNIMEQTFEPNTIVPEYKTGSMSQGFEFLLGRRAGTWRITADLMGSGVAGTPPDIDPLIEALFAKAAAGSSYSLDDVTPPSLSLWSFRNPAGMNDRVAYGSIVTEATFRLGQNATAKVEFAGRSRYVLDEDHFATATTDEKGGLTAFPAEPATPVFNGSAIVAFTGSITMAGNPIADLNEATIRFRTGHALKDNAYGSFYPTGAERDPRQIELDISVDQADTTAQKAIREAAIVPTGIAVTIVLGTVTGNIYTFSMPRVILTPARIDEQRRIVNQFNGSRCLATTGTAKDEISIVMT